jgi:chemotaxis response regulator CheB
MLKKQADMHVVATIGHGENILQMLGKLNPDIVLLVIKSIISYNIST